MAADWGHVALSFATLATSTLAAYFGLKKSRIEHTISSERVLVEALREERQAVQQERAALTAERAAFARERQEADDARRRLRLEEDNHDGCRALVEKLTGEFESYRQATEERERRNAAIIDGLRGEVNELRRQIGQQRR